MGALTGKPKNRSGLRARAAALWSVELREVLRWCLPALLLGLALRVALVADQPWAHFHDDAPDFLSTPDTLFHEHRFELHQKKTFLVPMVFTMPFFLGLPALLAVPVFQHLLGLGLIVLAGALCRFWFAHWRWFILPVTLLIAANPFVLWYEHTLMAETIFVFCTVLLAFAGTLYTGAQTLARFVFLCVALVLEAGARPEGKLLFGFAILLLLLLHLREGRVAWPRFAALLVLGVAVHFGIRTSQAGLLLYTSVARLTPENLRCAPGFDPYIAPLRTDLQKRWEEKPSFPRVRDRRAVAGAVESYLTDRAGGGRKRGNVDSFCLKLAVETCRRNLAYLPVLAFHKFRYVAHEAPSMRLDDAALFNKQRGAFLGGMPRTLRLSRGLTGRPLANEAEVNAFIDTHYGAVPWFNALHDGWLGAVNAPRLPDRSYRDSAAPGMPFIYRGLPLYFILAATGLLAVMLRRGPLQRFHLAWGLALLGFFFVIMLTGNVRSRFRVVFEPFWFIYLGLLADSLWLFARGVLGKPTADIPAAPCAAGHHQS